MNDYRGYTKVKLPLTTVALIGPPRGVPRLKLKNEVLLWFDQRPEILWTFDWLISERGYEAGFVVFRVQHASDAVLFKLTFGGQ